MVSFIFVRSQIQVAARHSGGDYLRVFGNDAQEDQGRSEGGRFLIMSI